MSCDGLNFCGSGRRKRAGFCEGLNDRVTLNARNFLISRKSISFSINILLPGISFS